MYYGRIRYLNTLVPLAADTPGASINIDARAYRSNHVTLLLGKIRNNNNKIKISRD